MTYDTRSAFGRPVARATVAAGEAFKQLHYRRTTRWTPPVVGPTWSVVPENYDAQLVGLRMRLGLTQSELAERIGAASKAVVYQWESRKRVPSPVLWARVQRLRSPSACTAHGQRTERPTHGSSTPHVRECLAVTRMAGYP